MLKSMVSVTLVSLHRISFTASSVHWIHQNISLFQWAYPTCHVHLIKEGMKTNFYSLHVPIQRYISDFDTDNSVCSFKDTHCAILCYHLMISTTLHTQHKNLFVLLKVLPHREHNDNCYIFT